MPLHFEKRLDRVCIDQSQIDDGLKTLPVTLMACQSFLMIPGPTYATRLSRRVFALECFFDVRGSVPDPYLIIVWFNRLAAAPRVDLAAPNLLSHSGSEVARVCVMRRLGTGEPRGNGNCFGFAQLRTLWAVRVNEL